MRKVYQGSWPDASSFSAGLGSGVPTRSCGVTAEPTRRSYRKLADTLGHPVAGAVGGAYGVDATMDVLGMGGFASGGYNLAISRVKRK
jgi:hypothetical protein